MARQLRCAELMPGCTCAFVAEGHDTDAIVANMAQHARKDHGMATIPPEIAAKLRAAVGE